MSRDRRIGARAKACAEQASSTLARLAGRRSRALTLGATRAFRPVERWLARPPGRAGCAGGGMSEVVLAACCQLVSGV